MSVIEDRFGPYRIDRAIARGGQGLLCLATDLELGRQVVLKLLPDADDRAVDRFRREAAITARIDHPSVCAVHDVGAVQGTRYMAMQRVEGRTLAELIASAKEPGAGDAPARPMLGGSSRDAVLATVALIERVAEAVHAVHERGVVHCDLKPGNIMITPSGAPVLLDFGLARDEREAVGSTGPDGPAGTPAYLAPEQIAPRRHGVDRRTDVHALGAILYESLTLRPPFRGPTRHELCRAILDHEPLSVQVLCPAAPRDLAVVVEKAMAREPRRRYASARELAEELRRVRRNEPIRARPISVAVRVQRLAARNPLRAASLTALTLVLLVALTATSTLLARQRLLLEHLQLREDARQLTWLLHRVETEHWPTEPAALPEMNDWLVAAEALRARLQELAPTREDGEAEDLIEALGSGAPRRRAASSALAATGRLLTGGVLLQEENERLKAISPWPTQNSVTETIVRNRPRLRRAINEVRGRRTAALEIRRRSIDMPRGLWASTIETIADPSRHPQYRGLRIPPQIGLVPLGPDPESGLHEFVHLASGAVPRRDPWTGRLLVDRQTGIVLVLVPGGEVVLGARRPEEGPPRGLPHVDPEARAREAPVHAVWLDPFFISKFEMTQPQWRRATGTSPSGWTTTRMRERLGLETDASSYWAIPRSDDRLPVESVSWEMAEHALAHLGLVLPTEAQWEHAARGGTTTVYWTGDDWPSLVGAENIGDVYTGVGVPRPGGTPWKTIERYLYTSPVGTFRPNPFGLHDVQGNVAELTRDWFGPYTAGVHPGDGERIARQERLRTVRGGSHASAARQARVACRTEIPPTSRWSVGVRPARPLTGPVADGAGPGWRADWQLLAPR
ncbi:MAG: bifunctional serine/threonine-protein kinase/formylglycine-generating enzyme family protein [Planctomycetota bacterium]|jgi:formylglycine-generating enzyme required for sulfatase activity